MPDVLNRFSQRWYEARNSGLLLPEAYDQAIILPDEDLETNIYLDMVQNMSDDFKSGRVTDLLIDDQDIKKPKNFFDFFFGPDGQDASGNPIWTPFPKQIQAATHAFQEHCTNTPGRMQCTDIDYVDNIPTAATPDEILSKVTFLEHGRCPKCGKTRMDQWNEGNARKELLVMAIGQRAGKDETLGYLGGYLTAGYLTLRNLGRAYRIADGTVFFMTFTALTHGQALKSTYAPFVKVIKGHPWFEKYHEMLTYSGQKAGRELYKIGEQGMAWPHHGLAVTVEAPHVGTLRGNAKIFATITEYAYFFAKSKDAIKLDGPAIFDALQSSFGTIKIGYRKCVDEGLYDMPPYIFPLASSPRTNKDGIMTLYRESKKTPTMYGMHCSTFEFNPDAREEDFVTNRATNMEKYRTNILALPADAVQGFIKSRMLVGTMVDEDQINAAACTSATAVAGAGMKMTVGSLRIRDSKSIDKTTPKVLGMDAGKSNNSFSGVVAHVEFVENERTHLDQYITVVDAVFEVIPQQNMRINYRLIYDNVILPLCKALNVQFVVADNWESTQFIDNLAEDIEEAEVQGKQYKCKYQDFLAVRGAIEDKGIILPQCEVRTHARMIDNIDAIFTMAEIGYPQCFDKKPVAHLLYQLLTVEDLAGKTVDKGENATDDTFRALVLAHTFCHDPGLRDIVLAGAETGKQEGVDDFDLISVGFDGRVNERRSYSSAPPPQTGGAMQEPMVVVVSCRR